MCHSLPITFIFHFSCLPLFLKFFYTPVKMVKLEQGLVWPLNQIITRKRCTTRMARFISFSVSAAVHSVKSSLLCVSITRWKYGKSPPVPCLYAVIKKNKSTITVDLFWSERAVFSVIRFNTATYLAHRSQ